MYEWEEELAKKAKERADNEQFQRDLAEKQIQQEKIIAGAKTAEKLIALFGVYTLFKD